MTQLAVRLDSATSAALGRLTEHTGQTRSEVVRDAIIEFDRAKLIAQMRRESLEVSDDDADRAEVRAVFNDMRSRRAW
ncbi:MAG: ribbon-helix-helix protein, CopG family [Micrococcales bacterium]|nr:ribbon-helix-helix protein, CopG family [Micrococcales bacterium]